MPLSGPVTASLWSPEKHARQRHEEQLQAACMRYLDVALPAHAIANHAPGEGLRHGRARAVLKASGYKAGWPDIEILWRGMPPTFVELKVPGGGLSDAQRGMHKRLEYCGCVVLTCRSMECVEESLRELGMPLRASVR